MALVGCALSHHFRQQLVIEDRLESVFEVSVG